MSGSNRFSLLEIDGEPAKTTTLTQDKSSSTVSSKNTKSQQGNTKKQPIKTTSSSATVKGNTKPDNTTTNNNNKTVPSKRQNNQQRSGNSNINSSSIKKDNPLSKRTIDKIYKRIDTIAESQNKNNNKLNSPEEMNTDLNPLQDMKTRYQRPKHNYRKSSSTDNSSTTVRNGVVYKHSREFDRHSSTGRGTEIRKGGAGKQGWGNVRNKSEINAEVREETGGTASINDIKPQEQIKDNPNNLTMESPEKIIEQEPEPEETIVTLDDYKKTLNELRVKNDVKAARAPNSIDKKFTVLNDGKNSSDNTVNNTKSQQQRSSNQQINENKQQIKNTNSSKPKRVVEPLLLDNFKSRTDAHQNTSNGSQQHSSLYQRNQRSTNGVTPNRRINNNTFRKHGQEKLFPEMAN